MCDIASVDSAWTAWPASGQGGCLMTKSFARCSLLVAALALATPEALAQEKPEAHDMTLLGYNDLQGRSAYQPTIHQQNGRWIAYVGHHGGTNDVPRPVNPLTGEPEYN